MSRRLVQSKSEWVFPGSFPRGYFEENEVLEITGRDCAVLFFDLDEPRMGLHYAETAIFRGRITPKRIFRADDSRVRITFGKPSYVLSADERYLFVSREFRLDENKFHFSWVIFDLEELTFAFVPMLNSVDYTVEQLSEDRFSLSIIYDREGLPNRNGEPIELKKLEWFPEIEFKNYPDIYKSLGSTTAI